MTDAINTHNRPRNPAVTGEASKNTGATGKNQNNTASQAQGNQSKPATIVELSNPNLLKEISEQIDKLPEVNEARVASIKQSLAQGEYKPDAEVIAKKFSEIEKLLP